MSGKKDIFVSMTREQRDRLIAATRDAFDAAAAARRLGVATEEANRLSDTCISTLMGLLHKPKCFGKTSGLIFLTFPYQ